MYTVGSSVDAARAHVSVEKIDGAVAHPAIRIA